LQGVAADAVGVIGDSSLLIEVARSVHSVLLLGCLHRTWEPYKQRGGERVVGFSRYRGEKNSTPPVDVKQLKCLKKSQQTNKDELLMN
jgi:hypothetical protein